MTSLYPRAACLLLLAISLASCSPAPRDIVVVWRNGQLVVDFPWSLWRLVGLQDRTYCIRRVELFDSTKLLWTLEMNDAGPTHYSCLDVKMPLRLGEPMPGFVSTGDPVLRSGVTYGLGITGIGDGRVDFTLRGRAFPSNQREWKSMMKAPCGSYFGECRGSNWTASN